MVKIVTRLKISRHKGIKKDDGSVSKISPRYLYTLINLDRSFDVKYFLCDCALQNATKRQKLNDSSKTSTLNKIMDFVPLINASWRSCEGQWRVSSVADAIGLSNMYVLSTAAYQIQLCLQYKSRRFEMCHSHTDSSRKAQNKYRKSKK